MRDHVRSLRRDLRFLVALRHLPWRVASFQWRAWRLGARLGDDVGRTSATRPWKLATILNQAADGGYVVELGTAQAWTTISLALARSDREVISYDPVEWPERHRYLELAPQHVRRRITFVLQPGETGPQTAREVDLLYIDSSHELQETVREIEAWRSVLRDGASIVLDDYGHPDFPGVSEAVEQLQLDGVEREGLFVHRATR